MDDLSGFQRDLLYAISGLDAPKGTTIQNELNKHYEQEIPHGRLYPNLDTLVDKGFIEKSSLDNRTNTYTLTQRRHREIKARREWEAQYISFDK